MGMDKPILEALAKLPPLYSQEQEPDPVARVKIFTPWSSGTWYLWEYDPKDRIAFGYCCLGMGFDEVGYVSVDELLSLRGPGGLQVELDLHFEPISLSQLKAKAA